MRTSGLFLSAGALLLWLVFTPMTVSSEQTEAGGPNGTAASDQQVDEHPHEVKQEEHPGHWMAPEEEAKKPNPVPSRPEVLAASGEIFSNKCSICHGKGGKGNGPIADSLTPRPTDLTAESTRSHSDGDLFYKISKGKGAMPGWEPVLTEEQRWSLVHYIRTLR